MKTSKKILSMLLALIMVLAVCPVITLSAVEPEPTGWDGKVPGTQDAGEENIAANWKTLEEVFLGDTVYHVEAEAAKAHIDISTKEIFDAYGLAMLSAYSNGKMTIGHWLNVIPTKDNNWQGSTLANVTWTSGLKLAANIDLTGGKWIPINCNGFASSNFEMTFDGQGHTITGMTMNVSSYTALLAKQPNAQFWGLFGTLGTSANGVTIQNVAILNASATLNNDTVKEGDAAKVLLKDKCWTGENCKEAWIGGIIGRATGNKITIRNCVVDFDTNVTVSGRGNAAGNGFSETYPQVVASGIIGWAYCHADYSDLVIDGTHSWAKTAESITLATGEVTKPICQPTALVWGSDTSATVTNILSLSPSTLVKEFCYKPWSAFQSAPAPKNVYAVKSESNGKSADAWQNGWGGEQYNVQYVRVGATTNRNNATYGVISKKFLAAGWVQNYANMLPVPAVFNSNYAQIGTALLPAYDLYEIDTAEKLSAWTDSASANNYTNRPYVSITADIDMTGKTWNLIPSFDGVIFGNGHVISNVTVSVTGDGTPEGNPVVGGLFKILGGNFLMRELAFVNLDVTLNDSKHAGAIFGAASSGGATFESVMIRGKTKGVDVSRLGTFGGYGAGFSNYVNCAYIGDIDGAGAYYHYAASNTTMVATNSFEILNREFSGSWSGPDAYAYSSKVYANGNLTNLIAQNPNPSFNSLKDANFKTEHAGKVYVSDMCGDNMNLGDAWYTYADGTPVQKCFGATAEEARALSVHKTYDVNYDKADDFVRVMGASIRTDAGSTGIRFSVEVNKAAAEGAQYGMLIVPTKLLEEDGETIFNSAQTLNVLVGTYDADGITQATSNPAHWGTRFDSHAQYNVALIKLPGAARELEFTVCAYVQVGETTYYSAVKTYTPVDIAAKAYLANDNKDAMISLYGDMPAFQTATDYDPAA